MLRVKQPGHLKKRHFSGLIIRKLSFLITLFSTSKFEFVFSTFQAPNQTANREEIITMNFYKDLQLDYENKALKWSVNFQGPEFDIPEKLKEDVALIGDMCKVS